MKVKWLVIGFVLGWLGLGMPLAGSAADADRDLFAQVKAKADKGDAEAQLSLGDLYAAGTGVARDPIKAAKWHRKAAEQGLSAAQYRLGLDYENADGVKLDRVEALRWFRRAAEQGLVEAQVEVGLCYLNGRGTADDEGEAVKWFHKAVDQGDSYAQYELGECYMDGTGVPKDTEEGLKLIQQAAERGSFLAENELGDCYEHGKGVPKDLVQAYKWYALAAARDHEHAADIRVSLARAEATMTKEEITQAQHLAHDFKPKQANDPVSPASSASTTKDGADGVSEVVNRPGTGVVNVKADDESCEVFVDSAFVGNVPTRLKLAEGAHVVEVKKAGFKDYRRELKVSAGSELSLHPVLEKQ
jgi:TPR repeat protein